MRSLSIPGLRAVCLSLLLAVVPVGAVAAQEEPPAGQEEPKEPEEGDESGDEEPEPEQVDPLEEEAGELWASLEELQGRRSEFEDRIRQASGEDLTVLEEQNWQRQLATHQTLLRIMDNLRRRVERDQDVTETKARLRELLTDGTAPYSELLQEHQAAASRLRRQRDAAKGDEHVALEQRVTRGEEKIQAIYQALAEAIGVMEYLEFDTAVVRESVVEQVERRAETLAGRIGVALTKLESVQQQLERNPDDADVRSAVEAAEERLDREADSLSATIALMERLDLEATRYQQLLIQTTGEISVEMLNRDVAFGLLKDWGAEVRETLRKRGPSWLLKTLLFLLVLGIFRILAAIVRKLVQRSVRKTSLNVSQLLQATMVSWSSRIVMMIGLLVALSQLGFEITALLAGLGIAGFIVGFALQDSLSNFAAGAMILVYRPFDVGDVIEASGVSGKVSSMSLVSTTILTFDNQTLIIPNTKIWGDVIRNVTLQQTRRIDLEFTICYSEDVDRVEEVLRGILGEYETILAEPRPIVEVHELGESGFQMIMRPWVATTDYWKTYWSLTRRVKQRFDAEGIRIALPRRDVRMQPVEADARGM